MSEETTVSTTAPDEGTTAPIPGEEPTATTGTQDDGQGTPAPEPKRDPWYQKRIDELTKARREAERRADALEALMTSRQHPPADGTPPAQQGASTDAEIMKRAMALAENQRLNEEANRVYQQGKGKYGDFDAAVQSLSQVADLSQKPDFLEAIVRLPNGADIYHHLGTNLDHAAEVLSLRGTALALELAKLSAELGKPRKTSSAPAPISPIGSSASPSGELSDDLPMAEWIKRRNAQIQKRRGG